MNKVNCASSRNCDIFCIWYIQRKISVNENHTFISLMWYVCYNWETKKGIWDLRAVPYLVQNSHFMYRQPSQIKIWHQHVIQTGAITSLNRINQLMFVNEMRFGFFEEKYYLENIRLQSVNNSKILTFYLFVFLLSIICMGNKQNWMKTLMFILITHQLHHGPDS